MKEIKNILCKTLFLACFAIIAVVSIYTGMLLGDLLFCNRNVEVVSFTERQEETTEAWSVDLVSDGISH